MVRRRAAVTAGAFRLTWTAPEAATRVTLRVQIRAGTRVVATSSPKQVVVHPPIVVKSRVRPGTVRENPHDVRRVYAGANGTTVVLLAAGTRPPHIGHVLIVAPGGSARHGVLGIVTSIASAGSETVVTTRPAPLQDAYSDYHLTVDDTLGDLATRDLRLGIASSAHEAGLVPAFKCNGVTGPITVDVDLSQIHVVLSLDTSVYSPALQFILEGRPTFTLNSGTSAAVTCTASLTALPIPLGATGLFLEMGPAFSFTIGGSLSAHLAWSPFIGITFFRSLKSGNSQSFALRNGGSASVTGSAGASLGLGLQTSISLGEGPAQLAAITGTVGPVISATFQRDPVAAQTCFDAKATAEADLSAHADVIFKTWDFELGSFTFGDLPLFHTCAGPGDGGPGGNGGGGTGGGGGGDGGGDGGGSASTGSLAASQGSTCAILNGGSVDCWGQNQFGELGNGSPEEYSATPVVVKDIHTAIALTAGDENAVTADRAWPGYACALLAGGSVECWGSDVDGELGDGTTTNSRAVPVEVTGLTNATAISASDVTMNTNGSTAGHTCALTAAGTVYCWGAGYDGQLGNGTKGAAGEYSATPVQVAGISDAVAIATGATTSCALLADGTVDCWGEQEGVVRSATPVPVAGSFRAIAGSGQSYCGLTASGTVDCWGASDVVIPCAIDPFSQCGSGSAGFSTFGPGIGAIAVGADHVCALAAETLECSGWNQYGQLGDGEVNGTAEHPETSTTPVLVSDIGAPVAIVAGTGHTCARLPDGAIDCWGLNDLGQLGDGTRTNSSVPVRVVGIP